MPNWLVKLFGLFDAPTKQISQLLDSERFTPSTKAQRGAEPIDAIGSVFLFSLLFSVNEISCGTDYLQLINTTLNAKR